MLSAFDPCTQQGLESGCCSAKPSHREVPCSPSSDSVILRKVSCLNKERKLTDRQDPGNESNCRILSSWMQNKIRHLKHLKLVQRPLENCLQEEWLGCSTAGNWEFL